MPITAAAAWALFSATQSNAAARDEAFAAGALDPLLLLVEGGGAQVLQNPPCPDISPTLLTVRVTALNQEQWLHHRVSLSSSYCRS